jgi:hypothetical protein
MQRWGLLAVLVIVSAFAAFAAPASIAPVAHAAPQAAGIPAKDSLEVSSQATTIERRIRVYPRYRYPRRHYHSLYPLPYGIDYPGPGAVRECVSRLVPEHRPSGTVIVPRMHCWWAWR